MSSLPTHYLLLSSINFPNHIPLSDKLSSHVLSILHPFFSNDAVVFSSPMPRGCPHPVLSRLLWKSSTFHYLLPPNSVLWAFVETPKRELVKSFHYLLHVCSAQFGLKMSDLSPTSSLNTVCFPAPRYLGQPANLPMLVEHIWVNLGYTCQDFSGVGWKRSCFGRS